MQLAIAVRSPRLVLVVTTLNLQYPGTSRGEYQTLKSCETFVLVLKTPPAKCVSFAKHSRIRRQMQANG